MSLLFNILSMFVIAFLPRSKCLLISWLQSLSVVITEPQSLSLFPLFSYFPWRDGTRCHDISFLNVEPQASFLIPSFTYIKRLFSSSSLSTITMVLSAYLRLLVFLPAILIPVCASSSPVFLMMCSAYKLNKQGDNIQPWHTPFPIWNLSVVPCAYFHVTSYLLPPEWSF